MGFPRQEYWSGLPFPSPGEIEPVSPALAGRFFTTETPGKPFRSKTTSKIDFNEVFKKESGLVEEEGTIPIPHSLIIDSLLRWINRLQASMKHKKQNVSKLHLA